MAGKVKELTDSTFEEVVSSGVTLIDFWAPWCPPCRMQGPIVEQLATEIGDKATVAKVNVDEEGKAAAKFGVASIPTLVIMKDGKEVRRFVGLHQQEDLANALNSLV